MPTLADRIRPRIPGLRKKPPPLPEAEKLLATLNTILSDAADLPFSETEFKDHVDRDILARFSSASENAIAALATQWIADQIANVDIRVVERQGEEKPQELFDHEASWLLQWGSRWYDGQPLIGELVKNLIDGDGYIYLARYTDGKVGELWWRDARRVEIHTSRNEPVAYYRYESDSGTRARIKPEDIVHVRHGIHPQDQRKGRPFYTPVFREMDADNEIARVLVELLRNSVMPRLLFQWYKDGGMEMTEEEEQKFESAILAAFGRGKRGAPAITGAGEFNIHQIPSQIGELGVTEHRRNFEARIMSAFKIHPLVIGLDSGMQYSAYNNLEVAERASWSKGVLPIMGIIERALTQQLLWREYTNNRNIRIEFNREQIESLREDAKTKIEREKIWNDRLLAGGVTLYEYRKQHDLDVTEKHKVFYLPSGSQPVKESEIDKPPEPPSQVPSGRKDEEPRQLSANSAAIRGGINSAQQ